MHPKQAQLSQQASSLAEKLAAKSSGKKQQAAGAVLWKYEDPEGHEFWLKEKKISVKSPYSGKSFAAKPVKESMSGVGMDLREESKDSGAGPGGKVQTKRPKKADGEQEQQEQQGQEQVEHQAVAPPGFEHVVKELKKNKDLSNPWAVAWSMKNKGDKPHKEAGQDEWKATSFEQPAQDRQAGAKMGMRGKGEVIESKRWKHKETGATASLYGAVPWSGAPGDKKEDWQLENVGYTIRWGDGTVGIGRQPFKSKAEAEEWLNNFEARKRQSNTSNG